MSAFVQHAELKSTVTWLSLTGWPMSRSSPVPFFRPPNTGLPRYHWVDHAVPGLPSIASGAFAPSSLLLGSYASNVVSPTGLRISAAGAEDAALPPVLPPPGVWPPDAEDVVLCMLVLITQAVAAIATSTKTMTRLTTPRAAMLRSGAGARRG
jgi:hypothetical protein